MYRGYFFKLFNGLKLALFLCVLISFSNLYSAPEKVATKTAAAKAAPASAIGAKPAAKAPAKAAAKPAAPKAVAKAAAKPTGPISLKAPITAGFQNVVSPDSKTIMNPDKTKSIASAKSFSEQLEELEKGKAPDKKKKAVKMLQADYRRKGLRLGTFCGRRRNVRVGSHQKICGQKGNV